MKRLFKFGIYHKGHLLMGFGSIILCTHTQAEFACMILEIGVKSVLKEGHYVAYDYA